MKPYKYILLIFPIFVFFAAGICAEAAPPVHVLHIKGQIDPAVAGYLIDGINRAERENAQAILVTLDTPGGLMQSTQEMTTAIFASKVPVIVYVYPNGATAASAGTFITMAGDIAAMVPVSNIGSASPVGMGPGGEAKEIGKTMKRKVENFAVEYARSIAKKRNRNADWAEKAVRDADNIDAETALKIKVIDYIAQDIPELMKKVDGHKVKLVSTGKTVVLNTAKAPLQEYPMGAWDTFLHYLSNPYVVLFLSMAAMYGIIYEIANPGSIFPGVIGGISLILLLYSFSVIPVNAAGFAFIALAIILFVAELFTPGTGILAFGGVVSMFFGLMMLFRSAEGFMVSIWVIIIVTLLTAGFFLFLLGLGIRSLKKPYITASGAVVDHIGEARTDLNPNGKVFIDGALWDAASESGFISKGEKVKVVEMTGLKLKVRKIDGEE